LIIGDLEVRVSIIAREQEVVASIDGRGGYRGIGFYSVVVDRESFMTP